MLRVPFPSYLRVHRRWIHTWFASLKHRPIDEIRERWGREPAKERWLPTRLFDLTRNKAVGSVDDGTWSDLEFERLFASADSTITPLGSQYLYSKLRTYRDASALAKDYATYQVLRRETALREQLQLMLWPLRRDPNAHICDDLFGALPANPRLTGAVLFMSFASVAALIAVILNLAHVWILVALVLCNLFIVALLHQGIHDTFEATGRLGRMLSIATRLTKVRTPAEVSQPEQLNAILGETKRLRGSFRWFLADRSNDLVASVYLWLNLLCLADHVAAVIVVRNLRRHRDALARIFLQVGSLDADIAIASWLERIPAHCAPHITAQQTIELTDGFHPLPQSKVMASIRAEHSIESGKSHFFAELERILGFVHEAEREPHAVFLIDELFRGTNTLERVAAAEAVLERLGRRAQVLVTTHDVELQHFLRQNFLTFHFVESPALPEVFDYRLRSGICTAKNAITLLEKMGFPADVIREARRLASNGPEHHDAQQ